MKYTLVKPDGTLGASQDFTVIPLALAPNKGRWLPDNPPAFNPATHTRVRAAVQSVSAAEIAYLVTSRPLNEVRDAKLAELQAARNAAEAADVTVQGKVFSAEPKIADLFAELADRMRRGKPSALTAIFDVDGTPVPRNAVLLEQIEDAIAAQTEAAWNRYGALIAQVQAATTVEAVDVVTW